PGRDGYVVGRLDGRRRAGQVAWAVLRAEDGGRWRGGDGGQPGSRGLPGPRRRTPEFPGGDIDRGRSGDRRGRAVLLPLRSASTGGQVALARGVPVAAARRQLQALPAVRGLLAVRGA